MFVMISFKVLAIQQIELFFQTFNDMKMWTEWN